MVYGGGGNGPAARTYQEELMYTLTWSKRALDQLAELYITLPLDEQDDWLPPLTRSITD